MAIRVLDLMAKVASRFLHEILPVALASVIGALDTETVTGGSKYETVSMQLSVSPASTAEGVYCTEVASPTELPFSSHS